MWSRTSKKHNHGPPNDPGRAWREGASIARVLGRNQDDEFAELYRRWWAPVIASAGRKLLDLLQPESGELRGRLADVGAGTGELAIASVRRWALVETVAVDASVAMLRVAAAQARRGLPDGDRRRVRLVAGEAGRLPLVDGSADVVVSAFVLQLVPDRLAALREAWRVLRPGGRVAVVTWQDEETPFRPADVFYDALRELNLRPPPEEEPEVFNFISPRQAAGQLRRAGFREVRSRAEPIGYRFDPEFYLRGKESLGERRLLAGLDARALAELRGRLRDRFAELRPEEFIWQDPVVFVWGRRPSREAVRSASARSERRLKA